MMHVQAKILEAKFDQQLSTDDAFSYAAGKAYREATAENTTLLEPIMRVMVTTPDEFLGNVISDLSTHGGGIERSESFPATSPKWKQTHRCGSCSTTPTAFAA